MERFELAGARRDAGSVAASARYLYAWGEGDTVIAYDPYGEYVTKFELSDAAAGGPLSWANGMLWAAGGDGGAWHGYKLKGLE